MRSFGRLLLQSNNIRKATMSTSATSAILYGATITLAPNKGAVPEDSIEKRHHMKDGKGFLNPWTSWFERSGPQIMWAMTKRNMSGIKYPDIKGHGIKVQKPAFLPSRETRTLRATWLGHACYYVEFPGGLRILFDPVFSERCSPFTWLGPKRYTDAPCKIEDIPIIDAVIISHNHYDHMDHPTIMKIKAKHPNVQFFAPLGNKQWFTASGIEAATELDWWEERDLKLAPAKQASKVVEKDATPKAAAGSDILGRISCLPCQHMSARGPFDKGATLWSSWSVESGGKKVWFGGDTGYRTVPELPKEIDDYGPDQKHPHCPVFKDIGNLRGPWDLGLIPIGAYEPRHISLSSVPSCQNPSANSYYSVSDACKPL